MSLPQLTNLQFCWSSHDYCCCWWMMWRWLWLARHRCCWHRCRFWSPLCFGRTVRSGQDCLDSDTVVRFVSEALVHTASVNASMMWAMGMMWLEHFDFYDFCLFLSFWRDFVLFFWESNWMETWNPDFFHSIQFLISRGKNIKINRLIFFNPINESTEKKHQNSQRLLIEVFLVRFSWMFVCVFLPRLAKYFSF